MNKIKDRITLCILAGGIGTIMMTIVDVVSSLLKISQRSYRVTAAGVWVSSRRQAESWQGQLLGGVMNLALSMVGSFFFINLLSKYGKDKVLLKGMFFGISFGAIINAILSGFIKNKVQPKDAKSNYSNAFDFLYNDNSNISLRFQIQHNRISAYRQNFHEHVSL